MLLLQSHQQSGVSSRGQTFHSGSAAQNASARAVTGASSCSCHPSSSSSSSSSTGHHLTCPHPTTLPSRVSSWRLQSSRSERGDRDRQYLRGRWHVPCSVPCQGHSSLALVSSWVAHRLKLMVPGFLMLLSVKLLFIQPLFPHTCFEGLIT